MIARKASRILSRLRTPAVAARQPAHFEPMERRVMMTAVPSPMLDTDIGSPTGGSANFAAGTYTVVGAGNDVFGASDAFHYVYEPLTGDGSVTVRVNTISANGGHSLAGLDVRSSLSPTAANLFLASRDDGSVFVNDRTTDGGNGGNLASQAGTIPEYLRITRTGSTLDAAISSDGVTFSTLASDTVTLPAKAYVGIAVASQTAPMPNATATFDHFAVTGNTRTGSISGVVETGTNRLLSGQHVWADLNNDGSWQPGEPAATTDANGAYTISTLFGGVQHVRVFVPLGQQAVTPATGEQDVTLTNGQAATGVNFIETTSSASIFGNVSTVANAPLAGEHLWIDTNNDGAYEPGELTAISDSSGNYSISGLVAGTYHVRLYAPPGQTVSTPAGGHQDVTLTEAQIASGINFKVTLG